MVPPAGFEPAIPGEDRSQTGCVFQFRHEGIVEWERNGVPFLSAWPPTGLRAKGDSALDPRGPETVLSGGVRRAG